jgi:tungstate transport system ATP-binding protein
MQKPAGFDAPGVPMRGSQVLPIHAIAVRVARGGRTILDGVDFEFGAAAGTTVLLGPNGAGKSLLARVLAGLIEADGGQLTWAGTKPDRQRMTRIGFVFQRPVLLQRTALANVEYALAVTHVPQDERRERAQRALADAGLAHLSGQPARVLSGGEQQRLTLARAVACNPELLILDEPTANLDPASTAAFERNVQGIRAGGTPILLITHDLGQARRLADHAVFMHLGRVREQAPAADFFSAPRSREAAAFIKGEIVI